MDRTATSHAVRQEMELFARKLMSVLAIVNIFYEKQVFKSQKFYFFFCAVSFGLKYNLNRIPPRNNILLKIPFACVQNIKSTHSFTYFKT